MNNPENQNTERRLEELELELERDRESTNPNLTNQESFLSLQNLFQFILGWFENLPRSGKIAIVVVGIIVSFSLFSSFLKIVSSLLTIAILSLILYGVYKTVIK